jgi:hypothetical protein
LEEGWRSLSRNFRRTSSSDWKLIAIVAPGEAKREEEILLRCWRFVALIRSDQRYERELSWISICIVRSTAVPTLCIEFPTITKY